MKIALAQINTTPDVSANVSKVEDYVRSAAEAGAVLVQFPEATMRSFGPGLREDTRQHAAAWQERMQALADEHGLTIVAGEFLAHGDRVVNQLAVYSPAGGRVAYEKIHLYDAFGFRESDTVEPGDDVVTVDVEDVTVGLAICYDIRFPKLFAELSRAGAQLALVSASWGAGPGKLYQWDLLARVRALDSNMLVSAVDQADPKVSGVEVPADAPTGVGGSLVVDPFGAPIAQEDGQGEQLIVTDIDFGVIDKAKSALPVLENARLGY